MIKNIVIFIGSISLLSNTFSNQVYTQLTEAVKKSDSNTVFHMLPALQFTHIQKLSYLDLAQQIIDLRQHNLQSEKQRRQHYSRIADIACCAAGIGGALFSYYTYRESDQAQSDIGKLLSAVTGATLLAASGVYFKRLIENRHKEQQLLDNALSIKHALFTARTLNQ